MKGIYRTLIKKITLTNFDFHHLKFFYSKIIVKYADNKKISLMIVGVREYAGKK